MRRRNIALESARRAGMVAAALMLTLSGCYAHYYGDYPPYAAGEVVGQPPPAPLYEAVPPLPYEGAVWVAGYWNWSGVRYAWVPGRYMRPPSIGLHWYPGGYIRRGTGYAFVPGRWAGAGWRSPYHAHFRHGYGGHGYGYRSYAPAPAYRPGYGYPPAAGYRPVPRPYYHGGAGPRHSTPGWQPPHRAPTRAYGTAPPSGAPVVRSAPPSRSRRR